MAETRRGYVFGAFLSGVLCVLLIIVAIASEGWVVSSATTSEQHRDSSVRYGLWGGELVLRLLVTPSYNKLYMTCVSDVNACAVSCKTEPLARDQEVRALAQGFRPNQACVSVTTVDTTNPLERPPVIAYGVYGSLLALLFLQLALAAAAAGLAALNVFRNPTEPVFGLPGCLWANAAAAALGAAVLAYCGGYWAGSGWREHLAFSYTALGLLRPDPALGFSYWLLLGASLCSAGSAGLLVLRRRLLEREPPPPTIKLENHSDGTVFLY